MLPKDGQRFVGHGVGDLAVAPVLFAHGAQGVFGASFFEFVQGDQIGKVQHLDLLELCRRSELAGHGVQREVAVLGDLTVSLTDAAGLQEDQVKARRLTDRHRFVDDLGKPGTALPAGHGAHEHLRVVDGVHSNPIPEQRPSRASSGGVGGQDRQPSVGEVAAKSQDQLVGQ